MSGNAARCGIRAGLLSASVCLRVLSVDDPAARLSGTVLPERKMPRRRLSDKVDAGRRQSPLARASRAAAMNR